MSVRPIDVIGDQKRYAFYPNSASTLDLRGAFDQTAASQRPGQSPFATIILRLDTLDLARPLSIAVEPDDSAYIAKCLDVPQVYGAGESPTEAIDSLKREIESLWLDLQSGDDFSDEFLALKRFLTTCFR